MAEYMNGRAINFSLGCTIVALGLGVSNYLLGLENRPQIGMVALVLAAVTSFGGFTMIGVAIWPDKGNRKD